MSSNGSTPTEADQNLQGESSSLSGIMRSGNGSNDTGESSQLNKTTREDDNASSSKQKEKAPRMSWTAQRKRKFEEAYSCLGELRATPSKIKELMVGEPDITYQHISSYLQKFRQEKNEEEKEKAMQREVHNSVLRSQGCMCTNPSSLRSAAAPYQFNQHLTISRPNYSHIQATGNLATNYYNSQTAPHLSQMANLSNFRTNFGPTVQRNNGTGLNPLKPIWTGAPNMVKLPNNIGVAELTPGNAVTQVQDQNGGLSMAWSNSGANKGYLVSQVQEQNGGLCMKGNNIGAREGNVVFQLQEQNGGLSIVWNNSGGNKGKLVSYEEQNGGVRMIWKNIGAREGNVVFQLQEQNGGLSIPWDSSGANKGNLESLEEQNGGLRMLWNNIGTREGNVGFKLQEKSGGLDMSGNNIGANEGYAVSQAQEQNSGLDMKAGDISDFVQGLMDSKILQFPDTDSGKDGSASVGNVSACLVTGPPRPHTETASGEERLNENFSANLFNDDDNSVFDMLEYP